MSMIINPFRFGGFYSVPFSAAYDEGARELSRTPGAGEDQIFTIGFWFKPSDVAATGCIFYAGTTSSNVTNITLDSNARIHFGVYHTSAFQCRKTLERRFRDPAQWYHILIAVNTTQAIQEDRLKFYVNGVHDTDYNTDATDVDFDLNETTHVNTAVAHKWGRYVNAGTDFQGLLAEYFIIEGSQLTPDDILKANPRTPQSKTPINIAGLTFGSEGNLLQSASSDALGADTSGNGNDWTNSGVTRTIDTPTDNFCVWNPYHFDNVVAGHLSNKNLTMNNSGNNICFSTMEATGKQYAELNCFTFSQGGESSRQAFGIAKYNANGQTYMVTGIGCYGFALPSGTVIDNGLAGTDYETMTAGETCCNALDADVGKMWVRYDDGAWFGEGDPVAGTSPTLTFPTTERFLWATFCYDSSDTNTVDFGQNGYEFTAPLNFQPVSSANVPEPAVLNPSDHFFSEHLSHDGISTAGTCSFDLEAYEWLCLIKNTSGAVEKWYWIDSLNSSSALGDQYWSSNSNDALATDANILTVSGTTFTLGSSLGVKNYIIEFHKAGLQIDTASNTVGSINTIATSVNPITDFFISTFTGTGANATIGNPLSGAAEMLIHKRLGGADGAAIYHVGMPSAAYFMQLNSNGAQNTNSTLWDSTAPSQSVINVGSSSNTNNSSELMVSYGWRGVKGYSAFGKYVGNGNLNGPFIHLGFEARSLLYKRAESGIGSWHIWDRALAPDNRDDPQTIQPDLTNIASSITGGDMISNGWKLRNISSDGNPANVDVIFSAWGGAGKNTNAT